MRPISQWLRLPSDLFFRRADERIYAAVRIGFAVVVLLNLISLWPDRQVFFSDAGMADRSVAMSQANPVYLSIFAWARSEAAVTGVMVVTALALVMLMAGVGARLAALWVLVWHISYMARAPLPLAGWDAVLRCFSFLILVSPMGKRWTLPAMMRGRGRGGGASAGRAGAIGPIGVPCYGLVLMRLQVLAIYWQAVLARLLPPDPYWAHGEFLSYFMLSHHARWPGRWVLACGGILAFGTYAVQFAEAAIPLLLWRKRTRWWGALVGTSLHAGICLFAPDFELFCLAMMMSYLAFLRTEDVEGLERLVKRCWKRGE